MDEGPCPECHEQGWHRERCRVGQGQLASAHARARVGWQIAEILCGKLSEPLAREPTYMEARTNQQYERDVCRYYEAVLKVEYPGRRVAVTPAPLPEGLTEREAAYVDPTGVLDVTVGALPNDPARACFRVSVQELSSRRIWCTAARKVREHARQKMSAWRALQTN